MIPIKITLSGFMSYQDAQTFDFNSDSLWVIIGKNASGKSTVFDAVIFVLYGKSRAKGIGNADLVNHQSDRAEIVFDFAVGINMYRVRRTINQKGHVTRQAASLIPKTDGTLSVLPISGTEKEAEFDRWIENEIGLNFDVFTTSVLLRQGKADALLEAGTDTRYNVLSQLIDLSKYETLSEKAHDLKKQWDGQATIHRENLNRIDSVTEDDLDEAQQKIMRETDVVTVARKKVDDLTELFGQANQWEKLNADLGTYQDQMKEKRSLIEQENEINQGHQRWLDLRSVMPGLEVINDLDFRIRSEQDEIDRLTNVLEIAVEPLKAAETSVNSLDKEVELQINRVGELIDESRRVSSRLNELSSTITLLIQIDKIQSDLDGYRKKLDGYSANLDDLLIHTQAEYSRSLEAQQAEKGLTRLASERDSLRRDANKFQETSRKISTYEDQLPNLSQERVSAFAVVERAKAEVDESHAVLARTETLQAEAFKRLENFNQVAGETKCRYCGQILTKVHISRERHTLKIELKERDDEMITAKRRNDAAEQNLINANNLLDKADSALKNLETELRDIRRDLEKLKVDTKDKLNAVATTYQSLPVTYRVRVALTEPVIIDDWLDTIYPTQKDIAEISADVKELKGQQDVVNSLTLQQSERDTTLARWEEKQRSLDQAKINLPEDWQSARAENDHLSAQKKEVDSILTSAQEIQGQVKQSLEAARKTSSELREKQASCRAVLETSKDGLLRNQNSLSNQINQLPENWQKEAKMLTLARLDFLKTELSELEHYENLHQQLAAARQIILELDERIKKTQENIDALPIESRQPVAQVEESLVSARTSNSEAESRLRDAELHYRQLMEQRNQYTETECRWKEADRKCHLYGILWEQFGERGIQRVLINKAELAIVHLANDMLDNLSGGRSKLKLREAGGNRKALDLEVWDKRTGGDKPLLVGLASGSQRFRIAISLALGIGQYIGNESHRIESVIIDEGFGSLDREGRESVIQELYNLRQHLKRIILVSHQEEFSKGFSTGYEICIVDGASQVKPIGQ